MADLMTMERSATMTHEDICSRIEAGTPRALFESRRVLAITPDATRSAPLPALVRAVDEVIGAHARQLDYMVALGTHPIMPDDAIARLYGVSPAERAERFGASRFLNHRWDTPGTLQRIGSFTERQISAATDGRFAEAVDITINRAIFEYDLLLIVGPVFPHEIVGFSGGHKYLFPGISGGEFLDFFHWLSAVITCMKTIGHKDTPARRVIEQATIDAHGLSAEEFDLKEASAEKLEARRDHRFIWEAREGDPRNVGELKYRCEVTVAGEGAGQLSVCGGPEADMDVAAGTGLDCIGLGHEGGTAAELV